MTNFSNCRHQLLTVSLNSAGIRHIYHMDYFGSFWSWDRVSSLENVSPRRMERRKGAEVARSSILISFA